MTRPPRIVLLVAAVAIAVLVGLWARGLPFWLDEEMIALNVRDRAVVDLGRPLWLGQSAPPGWLAVERLVLTVAGPGERALRLLALVFGVGTVAAATWVAVRWLSVAGGVVLVTLVGAGPWLIYHATEMKPYSADAFWACLLPALAAWVLDAGDRDARVPGRRLALWWGLAAVGMWFANGALFVTPWCAVVLTVALARREGWHGVWRVAALGLAWLAVFGALYAVSLRYALESGYLQSYWAFAMPPADANLLARVRWIGGALAALADKPGGSRLGIALWVAATAGFLVASRRSLAACFAGVPLTALALAAARVVPLYERLSLWIVPALFVGVALLADRVFEWMSAARRETRRLALSTGGLVVAGLAVLVGDVVGYSGLTIRQMLATRSHHDLDDRAGIRWLAAEQRAGDAVMTTRLGLPAVWWYGGVPLNDLRTSGGRMPGGAPVLELGHTLDAGACDGNALARALGEHERLLIYLGFRFDDVPKDFDEQLLETASQAGQIVAMRAFGRESRVVVVERQQDAHEARGGRVASPGCLTVSPALRW